MSTQSFPSRRTSSRSTLQIACAIGAAVVGLVFLLYYVATGFYNMFAGVPFPNVGFLVFVAIVGLLSIVGAIGYWMGRTWGWYIHLVSMLGQLLFPGLFFEFRLDLHHMIGWVGPAISLVVVVVMGINIRRSKKRFP